MFARRWFYDFPSFGNMLLSAVARLWAFVSIKNRTDVRRELHLPMLPLLLLPLMLHLERENAHKVLADGGRRVFGGAAMTRRRCLR